MESYVMMGRRSHAMMGDMEIASHSALSSTGADALITEELKGMVKALKRKTKSSPNMGCFVRSLKAVKAPMVLVQLVMLICATHELPDKYDQVELFAGDAQCTRAALRRDKVQ